MPRSRGDLWARLLVSFLIALVLLVQTVAGFRIVDGWSALHRLWPFLHYPMYSRAYAESDAVERRVLVGVLADGTDRAIRPGDLGLLSFWFLHGPVAAVQRGDITAVRHYIRRLEARTGQPLVAVRVEVHPLIVDRRGYRPGMVRVEAQLVIRP